MLYNFMDLDIKLCIVVSTWREVEHCRFCCSGSGSAGIPPPYEICTSTVTSLKGEKKEIRFGGEFNIDFSQRSRIKEKVSV